MYVVSVCFVSVCVYVCVGTCFYIYVHVVRTFYHYSFLDYKKYKKEDTLTVWEGGRWEGDA